MKHGVAAVLLGLLAAPLPGSADSSYRREIVDLSKFEHLRTVGRWYTHSLSPSGQSVAVFEANVVRVIDLREDKEILKLAGHAALIHDSGWSRDGRFLATSGYDAQVRMWDVTTGKTVFSITPHSGYACSVAFSADGRMLATGGSEDGLIKLIDTATGRELRSLQTPDMAIFALGFTSDGRHLVFTHSVPNRAEMWLRVIKTSDGTEVKNVVNGSVSTFAVSRDGRYVAYSTARGGLTVLETSGWTEVRRLEGHPGGASSLAFHPVGRYLASVGRDGALRFWDVDSGRAVHSVPIKSETESRLIFAGDGLSLLLASDKGGVQVYGRRLIGVSGEKPPADAPAPPGK